MFSGGSDNQLGSSLYEKPYFLPTPKASPDLLMFHGKLQQRAIAASDTTQCSVFSWFLIIVDSLKGF